MLRPCAVLHPGFHDDFLELPVAASVAAGRRRPAAGRRRRDSPGLLRQEPAGTCLPITPIAPVMMTSRSRLIHELAMNTRRVSHSRWWPCEHGIEPAVEDARGRGLFLASGSGGSAGLSVRALKAEMMTEMAMVTANAGRACGDAGDENGRQETRRARARWRRRPQTSSMP